MPETRTITMKLTLDELYVIEAALEADINIDDDDIAMNQAMMTRIKGAIIACTYHPESE